MKAIKLLLALGALSSLLCAILVIWNESRLSLVESTPRVFETMFSVLAVVLTWEATKIRE